MGGQCHSTLGNACYPKRAEALDFRIVCLHFLMQLAHFPDLRKVQGTALEPLLTKKLKHKLMPVFETRVRRTIGPVRRNGSRIEVALDEGEIRAGRRSAPISEVELELKGGDAGEVFELARELGKHVSVKLALNSKSQRGYDLLDNKQSRRRVPKRSSFGTA